MSYDDDRPGMMRVHIAQQRTDALTVAMTRAGLRELARERGLPTGGTKSRLAWHLVNAGVVAPGYDKAAER